ncbi:MAG: alpha/beta hydrolase [Caldilineaceae bacterium]|jgi:pimeloyl-ACP methyl ester carboxylesterase|nr:alpha/beta hydrolase [Caldilineaceae bacterium]
MFTNSVNLHVVMAGPQAGPLVILLHGFPEFWVGWRQQMPALAAAGYHVWAPDQRGYNRSDKPARVDAYHIDALAKDVVGLIEASGREQVYLAGHDWGAAVAWWVAGHYPARVKKLAILNAPHPAVMRRAVLEESEQRKKSWYIFFFQLPWLPEWALSLDNFANATRMLQASSRAGTFTPHDLAAYRQAWSQPGALTAMINWYRAMVRTQAGGVKLGRIQPPTLMIWGAKDIALGRSLAQPSIDLCDQGRLVFLEEASHWVQHEEPAQVNRLLLEFFGDPS